MKRATPTRRNMAASIETTSYIIEGRERERDGKQGDTINFVVKNMHKDHVKTTIPPHGMHAHRSPQSSNVRTRNSHRAVLYKRQTYDNMVTT